MPKKYNEQNLIKYKKGEMSSEEAKRRGRVGGINSGKARKEKKLFKEEIEKQLGKSLKEIIKATIEQAQRGNIQAASFLRDTIGEKPSDKVEAEVNNDVTINIELTDAE